jgi:hypothetical protein
MKHIRKFNEASILKTNNIHVLPTNKPSRLYAYNGELGLAKLIQYGSDSIVNQNIYITSSEEIKEGDYVITPTNDIIQWAKVFQPIGKKIILTTDAYLIKDGVQAIDDEFLEWFVKNPSCEEVDIKKIYLSNDGQWKEVLLPSEWEVDTKVKRLIIPKEEVKFKDTMKHIRKFNEANIERETLEEAAEEYWAKQPYNEDAFIEGAKWQQERSYSEEDMKDAYTQGARLALISQSDLALHKGKFPTPDEWFEQFKKK